MSFLLASFWYFSAPPVQAYEPDGYCTELAAVIDEYIAAGGDVTLPQRDRIVDNCIETYGDY